MKPKRGFKLFHMTNCIVKWRVSFLPLNIPLCLTAPTGVCELCSLSAICFSVCVKFGFVHWLYLTLPKTTLI